MKRLLSTSFPISLLALFLISAAPSTKTQSNTTDPVPTAAQQQTPLAEPAELQGDPLPTPSVTSTPTDQVVSANAAANYAIDWYSINGGGTVNASSTNYKMGASIGQSVAGAASSANYQMGIGFWYGAGGGGCACDCHNDPVCDAVISNVQDVVATIGVAFRGAAAIGDPNGACPYQTTDMNCDTFTSVIDVVKVVNVAFRGANPATEYCVACP